MKDIPDFPADPNGSRWIYSEEVKLPVITAITLIDVIKNSGGSVSAFSFFVFSSY